MTASELAALVGGVMVGPERSFSGVGPLETAAPNEAAYAQGELPLDCRAAVILVRQAVPGRTCVVVAEPKLAFIRLLERLFPEQDGLVHSPRGADPDDAMGANTWIEARVYAGAYVHESARLDHGVVVHSGAWVGAGCQIGAGSIVYPNAVLYPGTVLGRRCRIHAGAVLGADGFSYEAGPRGPIKVPQVGRVILGDEVEVGPNTVVDRAFLETTAIGDGAKIDALVMVGHNCQIGRAAILAGQVGLAGSVTVGDGAQLAGQAGVADHRSIGAMARVGARSGVHKDVPAGETVLGAPAMPIRMARRILVALPFLPELVAARRRGGA